MIITGNEYLMKDTIEGLEKVFKIKIQRDIKDFLGFEILEKTDEIHLYQKRIIEKMIKMNDVNVESKYTTPSSPGFNVVRPSEEEKVDGKEQKWFRANIGSLLYLVKLSRPDLANPVRELSRVMDGAAPGHVKELKRLINFLAQTKEKGLKMRFSGEKPWEIEGYSDSDFAGDKNGRKSVTGMIILCFWNSNLLEIQRAGNSYSF